MPPGVEASTRRISKSTWLALFSVLLVVAEGVIGFPGWLRDLVRTADLAIGVFIVVTAGLIVRRYAANYRRDPSRARLLPRHVVRLSVAVIGLTVGACAYTISLLGRSFVWYGTPLILPSFVVLATGLWDMVEWLPTRRVAPGSVSNVEFHHAIQSMEVKKKHA